jgi:hypothetical protein
MLCGANIEMDANSVYPWYLDKRVGGFMNGSAFKGHGMLGSCDGRWQSVRSSATFPHRHVCDLVSSTPTRNLDHAIT